MIDDLKSRLNDPCITCHWSTVGSDTNTSATVHITSPEVGHLARYVIGVLIITLACRECHLIPSQGYAPPARQVVSECCSSSQTSSDFAVRFLCAAPKRY